MEELKVDAEYPSIENLEKDYKSARIISTVFATNMGELQSALQFLYNKLVFIGLGEEKIANIMGQISENEMSHFEILGQTIQKLGVEPVFGANPPLRNNFFSTNSIKYQKDPKTIISNAIEEQRQLIFSYTKMLEKLDNVTIGDLISRIILDEELHIRVLSELMNNFQ